MPAELPIACSLTAEELPRRLGEMAALSRAALTGTRTGPGHAELRFARAAGVRERVAAIAAAEARCCAFLAMRVRDEPAAVVLEIDAPPHAELVLAELVAAFVPDPDGGPARPGR